MASDSGGHGATPGRRPSPWPKQPVTPIPDLEPFLIDPIFFGRINNIGRPRDEHGRPTKTVGRVTVVPFGFAVAVTVLVASTWSASVENGLLRPAHAMPIWKDLLRFMLRHKTGEVGGLSLFEDFPALILAVTITTSMILVYGLFRDASRLHDSMERMSCVVFTSPTERDAAVKAVRDLNRRFRKTGKLAPVVLCGCVGSLIGVNLLFAHRRLYSFLGRDQYPDWWASLDPFRPAGVVWVILGGLGIYTVYVQAVLGISYVQLLKRSRRDYRFRPNIFNPDQFFGWHILRRMITNFEVGVVCTVLSCFAMSYFLPSAITGLVSIIVLSTFASVVLYVFFMVTSSFRRHVKYDKLQQVTALATAIERDENAHTVEAELRVLNAYSRLQLVKTIPNNPIRASWLIVGAATVFIPVVLVAFQVASYIAPPK